MKRIHIALAVKDLNESIENYTILLNTQPAWVASGQYALFITDSVNFSITQNPNQSGQLRHLGVEDEQATTFSKQTDINGIEWEHFSQALQEEELLNYYPHAKKV